MRIRGGGMGEEGGCVWGGGRGEGVKREVEGELGKLRIYVERC